MKGKTLLLLLISFFCTAVLIAGEADAGKTFFKVGDTLPPLQFQDQFNKAQPITTQHRLLLFSREMSSNDIVHGLMEEQGADFFKEKGVVFTADISRMPSLITRFIALPNMRKYDYIMFLDLSGDLTPKFPFQEGKVTMILIQDFKINKILWASSKEEILTTVNGLPISQ